MEGNLGQLPNTVVELIPHRLYLGPMPTKKNKLNMHALVTRHGFSIFVNCMPQPRMYFWEPPVDPDDGDTHGMRDSELEYLRKRYLRQREICDNSVGIPFAVARDGPPKAPKLFKFICSLVTRMKADPQACLYAYDGSGAYAAGLVALCVWYFLRDEMKHEDAFDPVLEMRRRGKHHVVPEREKAFLQAIRSMCEKDRLSIHQHLVFGKPPSKKQRLKTEK